MYIMALYWDSTLALLAGRLLIGLGSPGLTNRRYILSYVHESARTKWSTIYSSGVLLGISIGPFLASGCALVDF